jgi:hypothetical protein
MRLNKFWLSATVLNIAMLSGASIMPAFAGQSEPISNMYGSWTLSYDWACSGNPASTPMTLNSNGTFVLPSQGSSGKWAFAGDTIILKFSNSLATTYSGVAYSRTMKGRSTTFSGSYGCWTASKTSGTTSPQSQQAPNNSIPADGQSK